MSSDGLYEAFLSLNRMSGLSEADAQARARLAAGTRDTRGMAAPAGAVSGFDEMVGLFEAMGLSPAAAKLATIGREGMTETQAREAWSASPGQPGSRLVAESATAQQVRIQESGSSLPPDAGGTHRIQIISAGWGTAGWYGPETLAEAATNRIFPAGLQMFLDHPTADEDAQRPERSVRDLAGELIEDARYERGSKALVSRARVFPPHQAMLAALHDRIGLSIRGFAEAVHGEAEGRMGTIITKLVQAASVDYVTKAGRGGKVLAVEGWRR